MPGKILIARDGALAVVRFNDPTRLNALDAEMREELISCMDELLEDGNVRAILMSGEGRGFCSGANLAEMQEQLNRGTTPDVGHQLRDRLNPLLMRMATSRKPIVAAVNGPAAGVGCGIALAADIVLVARSAYFSQAFINIGAVPDGGSTWFLPRLVGAGRAAAMMMLGERVDARTAVEWGMAYRMFEDEDLLPDALKIARQLASGPTASYARIKDMLRVSGVDGLAAQLEREALMQQQAFDGYDCKEGIAAFVDKREPRFKGV